MFTRQLVVAHAETKNSKKPQKNLSFHACFNGKRLFCQNSWELWISFEINLKVLREGRVECKYTHTEKSRLCVSFFLSRAALREIKDGKLMLHIMENEGECD